MSSSLWYQDKKYSKFWQHYAKCMYYSHKDAMTRCSEMENTTAISLYNMVSFYAFHCKFNFIQSFQIFR